ncbi:MAG TPA: hypothetical protein VF824_09320 [Thermoanaerobaculia bacterium]|jgi:hypothetical protein
MRRQDAAAALLFVALSIAMTWPLAPNLGRAVSDPGDPYITTWMLDWDWYATLHQPLSLFDANAFYPARWSLAFSENLYGIALVIFPLRAIGVAPLLAHNIALILGFAFCGFAAYLLGARLTGSFAAGLAAGVFYAFVPFRFVHLPHLQHIWGGWLPMLLVTLLAYAKQPTRRRAILFAAVFVMNGLTNVHFLFFGAFASAATAALLIPRRAYRELLFAMCGALLVLAPFLYPYYAAAKTFGMQRTSLDVASFSATPRDWITPDEPQAERRVYPGLLALVCSALALLLLRREAARVSLALLWIAIGFAGSLGLNFEFHRFLFGAVPGFRAIRAPARWAMIAYVGMAILIALVTAFAARANRWLALAVPLAFVVTLNRAPIRWYLSIPEPRAVDRWLAKSGRGAIVEVPIDVGASEYEAMFRATFHHRPMVNGVSGFAPPERVALAQRFHETPIGDEFVDALLRDRVELLIVHADALGDRAGVVRDWLRRELERGRIRYVADFDTLIDGDWVFRLGAQQTARPPRLEAFLQGQPRCGTSTMGALDFPSDHARFRGGAIFSGWAISRHGIRSIDLWLDNRRVRQRATLTPDPLLNARCPGDTRVARTRFVVLYTRRPENVGRDTDAQIEVTDGRGVTTSFEDRWVRWE